MKRDNVLPFQPRPAAVKDGGKGSLAEAFVRAVAEAAACGVVQPKPPKAAAAASAKRGAPSAAEPAPKPKRAKPSQPARSSEPSKRPGKAAPAPRAPSTRAVAQPNGDEAEAHNALPPNWSMTRHFTPSGRGYSNYAGPSGERARSLREAHALVSGQPALGKQAAAEARVKHHATKQGQHLVNI